MFLRLRTRSKGALHPPPLRTLNVFIKSLITAPLVPDEVESQRLRLGPIAVRVGSQSEGLNAHAFSCLCASPLRPLFLPLRAGRFLLR